MYIYSYSILISHRVRVTSMTIKIITRSNLMRDDVSILLADGHSAEALLTHILSHHDVVPITHTEIFMMIYGVSLSARRLSE